MTKAKRNKKDKVEHGGRRVGSGAPSWFRGKSATQDNIKNGTTMFDDIPATWSIRFTAKAYEIGTAKISQLDAQRKEDEPPISRNVFIEALIRLHGKSLTIAQLRAIRD